MGGMVSGGSIEQGSLFGEPFSRRWSRGKSRRGRPLTLRDEGSAYRVRIYCLGRGSGHRHEAITNLGARAVRAEGGTQEQAVAALLKRLDPSIEAVRDERGARLA